MKFNTNNQQKGTAMKSFLFTVALVAITTLSSNANAQADACDTDKEPLKGHIAQLQAATLDCSDPGKTLAVTQLATKGCSNAATAKSLIDGLCASRPATATPVVPPPTVVPPASQPAPTDSGLLPYCPSAAELIGFLEGSNTLVGLSDVFKGVINSDLPTAKSAFEAGSDGLEGIATLEPVLTGSKAKLDQGNNALLDGAAEVMKGIRECLAAQHCKADNDAQISGILAEISTLNGELNKLNGESTRNEPLIAEKNTKLKDAYERLRTATGATSWTCEGNNDVTFVNGLEAKLASLAPEQTAAAMPLLRKAKEATRPDQRYIYGWAALSRLPKDKLAELTGYGKGGSSEPAMPTAGPTLVSREGSWKWMPPLRVEFYGSMHSGQSSDTQHGRDFNVDSKGYEAGLQLTFDGAWRLASRINAIYGAGVRVGYRETAFRHELADDGIYTKSNGVSFSGIGKLGVNLFDWVSIYGLALGRANPAGYELGGGIEVTGISWMRLGVEGAYGFARNHADTGYSAAAPADFRGASVTAVLGVQF